MSSIDVAIDEHKRELRIAALGPSGFVADERLPNEPAALRRCLRRLTRQGELRICYEAGPGGFALQRQLDGWGYACSVVAPSLIPVQPGERRKTDRRDARKLAQLARAGLLTPVHVPPAGEEQVRDLVRCRETLQRDAVRARHYVLKLLRRHGQIYRAGQHWTQRHWLWLRRVRLEGLAQQVLEEYLALLEYVVSRVQVLDRQIKQLAERAPYRQRLAPLLAFRGVSIQTAMVLASEVGDFRRFARPTAFMGYSGLVPSERSSGERERRGPITKAGNARIRHVLVQAAWHYRHPPAQGRALLKRQAGLPASSVAQAMKAQHRLHRRFLQLTFRKGSQKAVVAVARELAGFLWAAAVAPAEGRPTAA